MNKLFTKIAALALGMTMATGVGVAVATSSKKASPAEAAIASPYTITLDNNASGSNNAHITSYNQASVSYGDITWSHSTTWGSAGNYIGTAKTVAQWGSKNKPAATVTFSTTGFGGKKIQNITVNGYCSNNTGPKISATAGGSSVFTDVAMVKTTATDYKAATDVDITLGSSDAVVITLTNPNTTGGSGSGMNIYSITVKWVTASNKLATPSPTYNATTKKVSWADVEHASSYQVKVDSGSYATATSPYDVSGLTTGVQHTVYVIAKASGYTDSDAGTVQFTPTVPVTGVSLNSNAETLDIGGNVTLTATVTPNNADQNVTWETSDQNVATVENGVVTAVAGGSATITAKSVADSTKSASCSITVNSPDKVLSYSNSPFDATSAPSSDTVHTKTVDSIEYQDIYGYNYNGATAISFKNSIEGAYLQNNTAYSKYIAKIIVAYTGSTKTTAPDKMTMYEGGSAGPSTTTITKSMNTAGDVATYTFSNTCQYFKFVQTTKGTYVNIKSFNIFLGSTPKALDSIAVKTAPTKTSYKSGEDFNATGLVITATYTDESTEDIAYNDHSSAFSFSPSKITAAGNVTITYGGKTCTQAVTLITVTNVTGVASAPTEVYQNGTIDASEVTLNVSYSDSSVGTVTADSVSIDTSVVAPSVTATATYNAATGTKTATWSVEVLKEPVYVDVSDSITLSLTGVSGGAGYTSWSNKSDKTSAVYSGNNAGGNNVLQFNNATTSGLYTSTSGGKLYSVSVDWNSNTASTGTRKLYIYGTNTKPTAISDASSATKLGEVNKLTPTTTVTDDDYEFDYLIITGCGSAVYVNSITVTWKVLGTDNPMTANPTLELGKSSISVGHTTTLTVTTTPSDSDEQLNVVSNDPSVATVSGSGKNYVVTGVAVGSTTITVTGKQSGYTSSIAISVVAASKTYEDKILTGTSLGLATSYADSDGSHSYEDVEYITSKVCKSSGIQFQKDNGKLYNNEELYSTNNIKSITLIMNANNKNQPVVYEGTSAEPSSSVTPLTTFDTTGANTYVFSSGKAFFKIGASSSGAVNIDDIIIELEDSASSVLEEARLAALAILTDLSGNCGDGGTGVVTQSEWDTLTADLTELDLSSEAKYLLKNAERILIGNLSQGGAEIENAMAHYDACVEKFGFTPFTGITNAQAGRISPINQILNSENVVATALIVIVSVISLSAVGGYFFLRRRKEN